jgi:hypothetical protein
MSLTTAVPKPPSQASSRRNLISVRVTDEEYVKIAQRAAAERLSIGNLARLAAVAFCERKAEAA